MCAGTRGIGQGGGGEGGLMWLYPICNTLSCERVADMMESRSCEVCRTTQVSTQTRRLGLLTSLHALQSCDLENSFTTNFVVTWRLVHYTLMLTLETRSLHSCIDFGNSFTTLFVLTLENSFTTLSVIYWLWKTRSLYLSIDFWELVHYRSVVAKNPSSLTLTANPDCWPYTTDHSLQSCSGWT